MKFRRTAVFLATVIVPAIAQPSHAADAAVYQKDIEFLLEQLPKEAGRFFELKKIEWPKVTAEFREAVKTVKTDADHLQLCARLMTRLRDGHAAIVESKVPWPDESKGRTFTGPRVHLVTSGGAAYVRAAFGDAERLGVKPGMKVEKINGSPALEWLGKKAVELGSETRGFSTEHQALYAACHAGLADWAGTKIAFEFTPAKRVEITRNGGPNYAPSGPAFPPPGLKAWDRNSAGRTAGGFGYIHLRKIPGDLDTQLDAMLGHLGEVPGLILDMRANAGGGCDHDAVFGRFVPPGKTWRQYASKGPVPFVGPMVVIVDAGVASAGETVAGMFKEDGRAYMIGDSPTAGMSSSKKKLPVPSGLFSAYFSVFSNKARFNKGRGIEGVGVPPNEITPYDPADLAAGTDTQIRRAEELLRNGFPAGAVEYQAAK